MPGCRPIEASISIGAARISCENQPWKVRMRTPRPSASTRSYRAAASAAWQAAAPGDRPRSTSASMRSASLVPGDASQASQSSRRWRISPAALRVNVIARMSCGGVPSSSARTMRETSIQVLPAPAQASTTTGRRGSQATA